MPLQCAHQLHQLARRVCHGALRHLLALASGVEHVRRQRGHLGRGGGRGPAHEVVEGLQAEGAEQPGEQGRAFPATVGGASGGVERAPPQPIAAALVTQLPAVTAGAVHLPSGIAGERDGAGAGIHDDPRLPIEGRRQRDCSVREDAHRGGHTGLGHGRSELGLLARPPRSRGADDRPVRREAQPGGRGGASCRFCDRGGRRRGAAGAHRAGRSVGAAQHREIAATQHDGAMGSAGVDADKQGGQAVE